MTFVVDPSVDYPMWIDPAVLMALYPEMDEELAASIVQEATWVLDELTHGYYHAEECWAEVFEVRGCEFILQRTPVTNVMDVERLHNCDKDSKSISFCQKTPNTISICAGDCGGNGFQNSSRNLCRCPNRIKATYTIGDNLPPGAKAATLNLATEYANAATGKKCNLPERITSIVRQGVSWTILDPQDFMDKGLVGISRIDGWISVALRSTPKGRAVDPLNYGKRLYGELIGYGACSVVTPPDTLPLGPATVDLVGIRAGDTNDFILNITAGGEPYNLTGVTVTAQARESVTSPTIALTALIDVVDAVNGVVRVSWPGDDVTALLAGNAVWNGVWDLQVDDGNEIETVVAGTIQCELDVTH